MIRPDALFLDIDGTILKPGKNLSLRMAVAIGTLRDSGTLICLASGRSWEALKPVYNTLKLDGPAICYNGAWIVEGQDGRCLFQSLVEEDVARFALRIARERGITFLAYRNSRLLYEREGREMDAYNQRISLSATQVNFDDIEPLQFTKALFISTPDELESVNRHLKNTFDAQHLSSTSSDPSFLEIMGGKVNKGFALHKVCEMHGIPVALSAAMGDGWNDAEMLETAGRSWIIESAPAELKSRFPASCQVLNVDMDGAAIVMESML